MSYVEHGPRIFLANRHNSGLPLMYGDYVLPKKRLEGRLKLHDSCSDIRAWSPNSLENSRYFRELSEHDSLVGKIIPFNVVIDNIIQFNSQAQNELQEVKRELQKYKSLKLTVKQQEQLQNVDNTSKELSEKNRCTPELLKNVFLNTYKSRPTISPNSYLSIRIPCKRYIQNGTQNIGVPSIRNQSCQSYSASLTELDVDATLNTYNLMSSCKSSMRLLPAAEYSEKTSTWIEYLDVALQVEKETRDVEVQVDNEIDKCLNKISTVTAVSQTSFTFKSSEENSSIVEQDKISLQTNNHEDQSSESDASYSESSPDTDGIPSESNSEIARDSDFDLQSGVHKRIIIQKDSEIIVLKNDLYVRDAELEELRDINKDLEVLLKEKEDCIHTQQGNLKILHDKMMKLEHDHNYEVEDLKQKLYRYKYLMEQLKQELSEKCKTCYVQSQEIEKLQRKLQESEQRMKKAESYSVVVEELRNVLREKDELKKQNYEQSCILADQEEKLNQLVALIKELTITYNEQMETKDVLNNLRSELDDKDMKISQYEEQLVSIKREISEFFNNLRNALNNLEDLNEGCESICHCVACDLDIGEESNNILYNISIIMTRFQSYKIESQHLLQQVGELKHYIEKDKQEAASTQNLRSILCKDFYYNSEEDQGNIGEAQTSEEPALNIQENKSTLYGIKLRDNFNGTSSEGISYEGSNNLDSHEFMKEYHNRMIKMSKTSNMDEVEKEILEYFVYFLFKLRALAQKLQAYAEIERPLLIKQTYYFYEILKDTQSAINISQDITLKKQLISELYNQHKEEQRKHSDRIKQLPNDLLQLQNKINEFIETILHQLLNEILHAERKDMYDERIDHAFEAHLKTCIDRINTALQGAGDQRMQIVDTIEDQQRELQKKDIELAQLKQEVAQQLMRIGEGDCLNKERLESTMTIKEQLINITAEFNKKNLLISRLEEQLEMKKVKLLAYDQNCASLRKRNKNLKNMKTRLLKQCQRSKKQLISKNKQIKNLMQHANELFKTRKLKLSLEEKIKELEKELFDFQCKNNELERQIVQANRIVTGKDETITTLKSNIDKSERVLTQKINEYENAMEEKRREIVKLEDENTSLNEKMRSIESKLVQMNETILSLTEQNDKINVIYSMQEDLTKLDRSEKKLKVELNNLRTQLLSDQNNNRNLDHHLDTFLRENEALKRNVEYWRNENCEFSARVCNEMIDEKLKNELHEVSSKIYERILTLRKQFDLNLNQHQDKNAANKIYYSEDALKSNDSVNKILKAECATDNRREMKENEIDELKTLQLNNATAKERILGGDFIAFEQYHSSDENSLIMSYKIKQIENEHSANQSEIERLLKEIDIKNAEIKHHKDVIKHLAQENADLRAVLKSQIEEYQDKLTLMKRNYGSSLNALCERHKANVEILQKQFEDSMKNERSFDSESWLQSLSMEELMDLHARISAILNNNCSSMQMGNESRCLRGNDGRNRFYGKMNEMEKTFQLSPAAMFEKELTQNKIVSSILKEQNSHLQHQWQFIAMGDAQKYQTLHTQDDKMNLEYNFGYFNTNQRLSEMENKYEKEKQSEKKNSSFDKQRWNFINQCSAYHKLSNAYEYSRILNTD